MVKSGDCLIWQTFASVLVPGAIINRIVAVTRYTLALKMLKKAPRIVKSFGATAVGLGAIPFIVHPIDKGVDMVMDASYRKYIG